jgi:hypothetical protein
MHLEVIWVVNVFSHFCQFSFSYPFVSLNWGRGGQVIYKFCIDYFCSRFHYFLYSLFNERFYSAQWQRELF